MYRIEEEKRGKTTQVTDPHQQVEALKSKNSKLMEKPNNCIAPKSNSGVAKAKELTYNLPGYGILKARVFPYTQVFFQFLSHYQYDIKFHHTNQLGALRDIFHGSHHTRYEYIFTQWTLISELCNHKGLGLSAQKEQFGKLASLDKFPSGAEILQCLVLLTNMGHLPGTFAASRAWLHRLKCHSQTRQSFRNGLPSEDREYFDNVLSEFNVYKIHLINAAFLLQRYKRFGGNELDYVSFGQKLLREFITPSTDNSSIGISKLISLYKNIRQLSFLVLDSHYSPVPFSIDFSSILLNFNQIFEDTFVKESIFRLALNQLEGVLQNSVYMSGNSLLATARRTESILEQFNLRKPDCSKVSVIRDILEPPQLTSKPTSSIFHSDNQLNFPEPDWDTEKIIELTYNNIQNFSLSFPKDVVEWETNRRISIGKLSCRVAAQFNPSGTVFRAAYALNNKSLMTSDCNDILKALKIINEVVQFEMELDREYLNSLNQDNHEKIFQFLLRATFGWQTRLRLEFPQVHGCTPFPINRGAKVTAECIGNYINKTKDSISKDTLNELDLIKEIVNNLNYRGQVICFLGSTKVFNSLDNTEEAELDGIIFFPAKNPSDYFAIVVEAKNHAGGNTAARKQLGKRLKKICPGYIQYEIQEVGQKGAFASLKIEKDLTVSTSALHITEA